VLGEKNGRRVVIVWRSVVGLEDSEEALMKDKAFIETTVLPALLGEGKPDRLLVNSACFVKDAETIEPEFKRLMFAPVGA
jgi:predicted ThiF/HesA family dinucleotide-utilizing enzyme